MIVYLDQNKWIELARICHGKDSSGRAKDILLTMNAAISSGAARFPLSAIHFMEFARIGSSERKARLGEVMLKYSKRATIACTRDVVRHELVDAFSRRFEGIAPPSLELIAIGMSHAFGEAATDDPGISQRVTAEIEKAMLIGNRRLDIDPLPVFASTIHQEKFKRHLEELHRIRSQLPRKKWHDALCAITLADIVIPMGEVMTTYKIDAAEMEALGRAGLHALVKEMPTRRTDVHLHWQVLKNPSYRPKITDMEDWAGLVTASCYCDVVVCEKHMADMLKRDGFQPNARIETDLARAIFTL